MNGAGRVIHAAVWSAGGHVGPGGRAMFELYERSMAFLSFFAFARPLPGVRWAWARPRRGVWIGGHRVETCGRQRAAPRRAHHRRHRRDGPITELAESVASGQPGA